MNRHNQSTVCVIAGAATLFAGPIAAQCDPQEIQKLLAADGASEDHFGESVSRSGDAVLIGAPFNSENGDRAGAAYVWRWDGASWVQEQKLLASDGAADDFFGWSVAISGATAIVGALQDDDNGSSSGSVYVFDTTTGEQIAKLLADDGAEGDVFGWSVAISGDTAIVGASGDDDNGDRAGAAYVFRRDGGAWIEEQKLLAADGTTGGGFGFSVAVAEDVAIVGAVGADDSRGAAYVFRFAGAQWTQEEKLIAPVRNIIDTFGHDVDVSGDVIIVSSEQDDLRGFDEGSAHVFRWSGSQWNYEQMLIASDGESGERFGTSLSLDGDLALIGSPRHSAHGNRGSAYLFRWNGSTWVEEQELIAGDGSRQFSFSVCVDGNAAIIGANADDENAPSAGAAYIFDLNCDTGTPATLTDFTIIDGTLISGGLPELAESDDTYLETEAKVTGEAAETHRLLMRIRAMTAVQNPDTIDITLEAHITDIEAIVTLFLRNFQTGQFEQVGQFTNGLGVDTTNTVNVPNAWRFVRPNGRIVLRVKKIVILPFTLGGFHSLEDLLEIAVR